MRFRRVPVQGLGEGGSRVPAESLEEVPEFGCRAWVTFRSSGVPAQILRSDSGRFRYMFRCRY